MMQARADDAIELAATLVGYRNASRYRNRAEFLFKGISLQGKRVLDVGCGKGAWAIWTALHGADEVVGLEPEADGSTGRVRDRLQENITKLGLEAKIVERNARLEEFGDATDQFDMVIMFNVINHLDEGAVMVLHQDAGAFEKYVTLLKKLRARIRDGGWVIVADCARRNSWNQIGLTAPFARSIEWHKHQNPGIWAQIFAKSGYSFFDVRWSPLQPFPRLTSNWLVHYLTCSHFVLRLRAA